MITLYIYFGISLFFLVGISVGRFSLDIQSKATGEYLDKDTSLYRLLVIIFSIGWIFLVIGVIRNGKSN